MSFNATFLLIRGSMRVHPGRFSGATPPSPSWPRPHLLSLASLVLHALEYPPRRSTHPLLLTVTLFVSFATGPYGFSQPKW